MVKEFGGKPFLTDCNTSMWDHGKCSGSSGQCLQERLYPYATGCQVLIADGLKGTDEVIVPIDGEHVKEAKIGRALMDADILISLTHFKGHEATGFGGTLKNIGMGGGSRAGKMEMHNAGKPFVRTSKCVGCGCCTKSAPIREFLLQRAKLLLMKKNAWDAEDVSAYVQKTRSAPDWMRAMIF